MQTFTLCGANKNTGDDMTLDIDAETKESAEAKAQSMNMIIESCTIALDPNDITDSMLNEAQSFAAPKMIARETPKAKPRNSIIASICVIIGLITSVFFSLIVGVLLIILGVIIQRLPRTAS